MKQMSIIFILIQFVFLTQSCEKMKSCKDDELTIVRTDNNSNKLRLDGYYYGNLSDLNADNSYIYFLFQNGIFLDTYSFDLSDVETGNVKIDLPDLAYEHEGSWGVYKVDNNNIEIERWVPRSCGGVGLLYKKGTILNDTTFKITYLKHSVGGKTERKENIEAIFKFQEYSPKPDSTVTFIP